MQPKITIKLDTRGLNASLTALAEKSRRLPSFLVNSSCKRIAWDASQMMPVVPVSQIESEMEATVTPGILKSGARSTAKKRAREEVSLPTGGRGVAAMIVVASMHPGSKYNLWTGNVFQRAMIKTQGRAAFWTAIDLIAQRMVKARFSSSGFFKTAAMAVWTIFQPATSRNPAVSLAAQTGFDALPGAGNVSKRIGKIAGGVVATGTGPVARASFWVAATEPESKGSKPKALYTIAQPVWERAIAAESARVMGLAEQNFAAAARESGFPVK